MTPWTVFLMVNVAQHPIKECEIHVHDNPDTMVFWRNWFTSPFNQRWVILMRITTASQKVAKIMQQKWLAKTRGVSRFIAKAFYLAKPLVEAGTASLEIVPWTLQEKRRIMNTQYRENVLNWPPMPLEKIMTRHPPSICTSTADYVRMYDIQHDKLKEIPVNVLERFINIMSQ